MIFRGVKGHYEFDYCFKFVFICLLEIDQSFGLNIILLKCTRMLECRS